MLMKRLVFFLIALLVAGVLSTAAAQDWSPEGPITIIVPWSAGGATDSMVRVVAGELEDALGSSVVVVNQPGASGAIGTKNALEAPKDCTTWASGAASDVGTYPVLGSLDTSLDDWHLYLTVANVAVVSVNADSPYETFDELLTAFKDAETDVTVATAGQSSAGHNAIELIANEAGFEYSHVTYEGGNPAVIATVAGETAVTTQLAGEQADMIRGERLRPLAVVGDESLSIDGYGSIPPVTNWLPDLQAATNYFGIWVPKGVPDACVETFNEIWENEIAESEALQRFASERGSLFAPLYGEEAQEAAFPMVQSNAWTLFNAGEAPNNPADLGIPRPEGMAE
jgi:tripartite-type tricarboxylate transporter receptor subunit TctC